MKWLILLTVFSLPALSFSDTNSPEWKAEIKRLKAERDKYDRDKKCTKAEDKYCPFGNSPPGCLAKNMSKLPKECQQKYGLMQAMDRNCSKEFQKHCPNKKVEDFGGDIMKMAKAQNKCINDNKRKYSKDCQDTMAAMQQRWEPKREESETGVQTIP